MCRTHATGHTHCKGHTSFIIYADLFKVQSLAAQEPPWICECLFFLNCCSEVVLQIEGSCIGFGRIKLQDWHKGKGVLFGGN